MKYFLYFSIIVLTKACTDGFYPSGEKCLPCHSSCKTCTEKETCSTCEDHMFFDSDNLCTMCPEGDYFDFSMVTCRSCESSCNGFCKSQPLCFECSGSDIFDLESMSCVPSCGEFSVPIHDPEMFNLGGFCRKLEFYIDPESSEIIELGTRDFPYRTLTPVFAEVLKHYSHSGLTINVLVKEGTTLLIEDSKTFIINLTEFNVLTYSESGSTPGYANLISTDVPSSDLSSRAGFNIVKSTAMNVSKVIEEGSFSESELTLIGRAGDTFQVTRTSFSLSNFRAYRISNNTITGTFVFLIYLQEKIYTLSKN